jgi:hypothetical protein
MGHTCITHETDDKCTQILLGKLEKKRPIEKPRRRWRITLKLIDIIYKQSVSVDCIHLLQCGLLQGRNHR